MSAHKKGSILGFGKSKSIERLKAGIQMEGDSPAEFTLEQVGASCMDGLSTCGVVGGRVLSQPLLQAVLRVLRALAALF